MSFYDNFALECAKIGKSPTAVVLDMGMSASTLNGWKNGSKPRKERVYQIADYFGITVQELTGKDDDSEFLKNFCNLCRAKGKSTNDVISELGLANSSMHYWSNGSSPHGSTLKKIADYFEVGVADLLGIKKETAPENEDSLSFPVDEYERLTPENRKIIKSMIEALASGKSRK